MSKTIELYLVIFAILNFVVIVLFKCRALSRTLFFYRGFTLIALSCILTTSAFLALHYKIGEWRVESIIAAVIIAASLQLAFFVTVPVTLDRSISVFLLNRMNSFKEGMTKEDMTKEFLSEYLYKQDAMGRRIFEQTASGNIEVSQGVIKLSSRGRCFVRVAGIIKHLYGI